MSQNGRLVLIMVNILLLLSPMAVIKKYKYACFVIHNTFEGMKG